MMNKIIPVLKSIVMVFAMVGASMAQNSGNEITANSTVDAVINFEHMEFDFGAIPPGAGVAHEFSVKNEGSDTLVIHRIKPG